MEVSGPMEAAEIAARQLRPGRAAGLRGSGAFVRDGVGALDNGSSIPPIPRRLRGQLTDLARAFAAVWLGMCADKERLPWDDRLATGANHRAPTPTLYSPDTGTGVLDIR